MTRPARVRVVLAIAGSLALGACASTVIPASEAGVTDTGNDASRTCRLPNGGSCAAGSRCPAGDGCNTCACGTDGAVICTLRDCAPVDAGPPPCRTEADCAQNFSCVYSVGCATGIVGSCQPTLRCTEPNVYCDCDGVQFLDCAPRQPFAHEGRCH